MMKKVMVALLLVFLTGAAIAQEQARKMDIAVMYSSLHTNAPVGACDCFWMNGGTAEFAVPVWKNFSAVGEVGGQRIGMIPNFQTGLSLLSGMGGLRLRVPNHTVFQPFAQTLFGGVHGFDSYFPAPVGKYPTSYDTSFAMTLGGGIDLGVSKHIWIRAIQTDYHYSELRNVQGNRQNQFRVSCGVVFRFQRLGGDS